MQGRQSPDRRPMSQANKLLIVVSVLVIFGMGFLSIYFGGRDARQQVASATPTPEMTLSPQEQLTTIDEALENITPTPPPTPIIMQTATPVPTQVPNFQMTPQPTDIPTLKKGSSGDDVRKLQARLIELKYLRTAADDGQFGKGTENAVKAFQSTNGLNADGAAGAKTLTLLYSDAAKPKQK